MLLSEKNKTFQEAISCKFLEESSLESKVSQLRTLGKTIGTLNGSFDLLHAGHLEMLYQASLQADVLIVALNSDASIQKYKSSKRPIIPLLYRMQMIASLSMVDFVTYFEQTDPISILEKIRPDVHTNGAEYGENCIEAEVVKRHGGRIHIVPLVQGLSTTQIIKKIVSTCD